MVGWICVALAVAGGTLLRVFGKWNPAPTWWVKALSVGSVMILVGFSVQFFVDGRSFLDSLVSDGGGSSYFSFRLLIIGYICMGLALVAYAIRPISPSKQ
jgi:hypothetical protein